MRFDSDPELAVKKYKLMCSQLTTFFENRGCSSPGELVDDAVDIVASRIAEGEDIPSAALASYFYGVAKNLVREHLRSPEKRHTSLDEISSYNNPSVDPAEIREDRLNKLSLEQKLECLEACIRKLPDKMQRVIVSYYEGEEGAQIDNRAQLAEIMGISMSNLRIKVHRVRRKLAKCIISCIERQAN
jgi:RNA polymerase sigma factor (sigma-70 family)